MPAREGPYQAAPEGGIVRARSRSDCPDSCDRAPRNAPVLARREGQTLLLSRESPRQDLTSANSNSIPAKLVWYLPKCSLHRLFFGNLKNCLNTVPVARDRHYAWRRFCRGSATGAGFKLRQNCGNCTVF